MRGLALVLIAAAALQVVIKAVRLFDGKSETL